MIRLLATGLTYSLSFDFRDDVGSLTSVDSPVATVYDPYKNKYLEDEPLVSTATAGKYTLGFFAPSGLTVGSYIGVGVGITNSYTLFSDGVPFEVFDPTVEPLWLSVSELRTYMELSDDDHTDDAKLKQILGAAIELVEAYTQRHYGIRSYTETHEVINTDRIKLKRYPVQEVTSLQATYKIIPRNLTNLTSEAVVAVNDFFQWRLDSDNGIMFLTDAYGFSATYDETLVVVTYLAGYATVPEPVRSAALSLAKALNALSCISGTEVVRLADISYQPVKSLFGGPIGDMLNPFKNMAQV